jgi:hypothetical protein
VQSASLGRRYATPKKKRIFPSGVVARSAPHLGKPELPIKSLGRLVRRAHLQKGNLGSFLTCDLKQLSHQTLRDALTTFFRFHNKVQKLKFLRHGPSKGESHGLGAR